MHVLLLDLRMPSNLSRRCFRSHKERGLYATCSSWHIDKSCPCVDINCKLLIVSIFLPIGANIFRLMVWRRGWCLSPNHSAKIRLFWGTTKFLVVIRADFQQLSNCKLVNNYKSLFWEQKNIELRSRKHRVMEKKL